MLICINNTLAQIPITSELPLGYDTSLFHSDTAFLNFINSGGVISTFDTTGTSNYYQQTAPIQSHSTFVLNISPQQGALNASTSTIIEVTFK